MTIMRLKGPTFTIAMTMHRRDGGTGSTRVSNAVPLRKGDLTLAGLGNLAVWVGDTEKAIAVSALDMTTYVDGTLRGVAIQFDHSVDDGSDIAAEIRIGVPRGTIDITPTSPAPEDPSAVCVPTDAEFLSATGFYGMFEDFKSEAWIDANLATLYQNYVDLLKVEVPYQRSQYDGGNNNVAIDGGGYDFSKVAMQGWLLTGEVAFWDTALVIAEAFWSSGHGQDMDDPTFYQAHIHTPYNGHIRYGLAGSSTQRSDVDLVLDRWWNSLNTSDDPIDFGNPPAPNSTNAHAQAVGSTYYEPRITGKIVIVSELHRTIYDPAYSPYGTDSVVDLVDQWVDDQLTHEQSGGTWGGGAGTGLTLTNHDRDNGDGDPAIGVKLFMQHYLAWGLWLHHKNGGTHATDALAMIVDYVSSMHSATVAVPGTPAVWNGDAGFTDTQVYVRQTVLQDPNGFTADTELYDTEELFALAMTPWMLDYIENGTASRKTRYEAAMQAMYDNRADWESSTPAFAIKFMHQVFDPLHLIIQAAQS